MDRFTRQGQATTPPESPMTEKQSKVSTGRGGKREGAGRPKGSLDQGNKLIRDMISDALDEVGGVDYLVAVALMDPKAFTSLIGKVLPIQVTGAGGGPLQFQQITRKIIDPAA